MADLLDEHDGGAPAVVGSLTRRRPIAPFLALGIAVVLAVFVWVAATSDGGEAETAETPLLDQPAPEVHTATLDGAEFDLATRRGSWVVLNWFATWCPPCVREHPELVRFAEAQAANDTGVELYSVIFNDETSDVRAFFDERGGDWPILTDNDGAVSVAFGVAKAPETWIIDPDGVVRARVIREVSADFLTGVLRDLGATS